MNSIESKKVGDLLRGWRERRRLSQLDLAYDAGISQRHLSFVEIGRSQPSREMILRLAEQLQIPLRERNVLLTAAGFAPVFPETPLGDGALAAARRAVDLILTRLEPNPTFVVDRHWNLIERNKAARLFLTEVDPSLLAPPVNMLRLCLHPKGFTPQVINYSEWRKDILDSLNRLVANTADAFLMELANELESYPKPATSKDGLPAKKIDYSGFAVPLRLMTEEGELSFVSTVTTFGTPIDITLSELAIETYFPADDRTAEIMNRIK